MVEFILFIIVNLQLVEHNLFLIIYHILYHDLQSIEDIVQVAIMAERSFIMLPCHPYLLRWELSYKAIWWQICVEFYQNPTV